MPGVNACRAMSFLVRGGWVVERTTAITALSDCWDSFLIPTYAGSVNAPLPRPGQDAAASVPVFPVPVLPLEKRGLSPFSAACPHFLLPLEKRGLSPFSAIGAFTDGIIRSLAENVVCPRIPAGYSQPARAG
jgi:hypothetical protein